MRRGMRLGFALSGTLLLAGCENAVEHLAVEQWRDVGSARPPAAVFGTLFATETIAPGRGPVVSGGELVDLSVASPGGREQMLSMWTGTYADADLRLMLGSDGLRSALVGRRVGERFVLRRDDASPAVARLPVDGFMSTAEFESLRKAAPAGGGRVSPREWPSFDFASDEQPAVEWTFEVRATCPARLLHRAAALRQWGYVLELMGADVAPRREGTLHWLAIEASCEEGARRFQIGPLYDAARASSRASLFDWQASYRRLRPTRLFPADR